MEEPKIIFITLTFILFSTKQSQRPREGILIFCKKRCICHESRRESRKKDRIFLQQTIQSSHPKRNLKNESLFMKHVKVVKTYDIKDISTTTV